MEIIDDRRKNQSKKWDRKYIEKRFKTQREDVLPLFIADMDFAHSLELRQQYLDWVARDDFGYFDVTESFYTSIIDWKRYKHHIELKREWLLPATGTISGLHLAAASLCEKRPLNFLCFTPVYGGFKGLGEAFGTLHTIALEKQSIDFTYLDTYLSKYPIDIIVFCNPHNPVGKVWTYEELASLVKVAKKHDVILLSDEIHSDFVFEETFTSLAHFFDEYDQIVISDSANKTFNLSGLNSSYLITSNKDFQRKIQAKMDAYHLGMNRVGMVFTEISYRYGRLWHEEVMRVVWNNVLYVQKNLHPDIFQCQQHHSSYLLWIRLQGIKDVDRFVIDLAQKTGVLLETGSRFIADYDPYVRMNVASDPQMIVEAVEKMNEYVKSNIF